MKTSTRTNECRKCRTFFRWAVAAGFVLALNALIGGPDSGRTQTLPGSSQSQGQSPVTTPTIQPFSAPTSALPANIVTPSTTNQLAPSTGPSTSFGGPAFSGAGRGLPGMQGGPPVKSPMGAQDPTADYMTPPVLGPLFCDPAINIPC